MASEQDFTVRAYDLGKKPGTEKKYRVRLYSGNHMIGEWGTTSKPCMTGNGCVYWEGVTLVSGTVIVEEVKP